MVNTKAVFLRLLAVSILTALAAPAQIPPPPPAAEPADDQVIRVDVDLVNIFFSARTKKGAYVPDLTKNDIEVYENGARREVSFFSRETDLPLTIGLLVDVSRSQENLIQEERMAASQFFRDMLRKEKDLAFIISFGSDAELLQDLTSSAALLQEGLGQLRVNATGGGAVTPPTIPVPVRGTVLYEAVWLAAKEKLSEEVGRKVMVIITDGVDVGSRTKIEAAIEEAHRADAIIYGILFEDPRYTSPMYGGFSGEGNLKRLSQETGGRVFRVERRTPLSAIFKQIEEEVRSQYTLAFTPGGNAKDGQFRRLEIRPKNRDLRVQARKGYFPPKGGN